MNLPEENTSLNPTPQTARQENINPIPTHQTLKQENVNPNISRQPLQQESINPNLSVETLQQEVFPSNTSRLHVNQDRHNREQKPEPQGIFVYGTLMAEEFLSWVLTGSSENHKSILALRQRAILRRHRRIAVNHADYPALIQGSEFDKVEGFLVIPANKSQWKKLDDFEGESYRRQLVQVELSHSSTTTVPAFVYVWQDALDKILSYQDWSYEFFRKHRLEDWLNLFDEMKMIGETIDSTPFFFFLFWIIPNSFAPNKLSWTPSRINRRKKKIKRIWVGLDFGVWESQLYNWFFFFLFFLENVDFGWLMGDNEKKEGMLFSYVQYSGTEKIKFTRLTYKQRW